jgi:hypothetical protein
MSSVGEVAITAMSNEGRAPKRITPAEIERAMESPASVFGSPEEVLEHPELTGAQKIEILRRWQYDAVEVDVAVDEGMPGDDDPLLRRIMLALGTLTGPIDLDHLGPNKQHGLPGAAADAKANKRRP